MTRVICIFLILLFSHLGATAQKIPNKYKKIQQYIDKAVNSGLSGVVISIHHPKFGNWTGVSGYANEETKLLMRPDHIMALASISKTYTATAVMLLVEEGKIGLDDKINKYLPEEIVNHLANGNQLSIRHMLNMSSGLVNYEQDSALNAQYLSGQLRLDTISKLEMLQRTVFEKPAKCPPGNCFYYSSTNYLLLAMIMDNVLNGYHGDYYEEKIFKPLGLTNTYYRNTPPKNHVQTYGDFNKDGIQENITDKTIETTNWFVGDDGIYASSEEAILFMEALMSGKIVNANSLKEMKTIVFNEYGLGLEYDKGFPFRELIGHSGSGIGTRTDLYHFPKQGMTVAILTNSGLRGANKKFSKAYYKMRDRIIIKLFIL